MTNLDNILKYQKLDLESRKIVDEVTKSTFYKNQEVAKQEFNKEKDNLLQYENMAEELLKKIKYKEYCEDALKQFNEVDLKNKNIMDIQKLDDTIEELGKYKNKLVEVERKLNEVKTKSDELIKKYKESQTRGKKMREAYILNKNKFEELRMSKKPQMDSIKKEMFEIRESGDKAIFKKYDELSSEKKLPAFVALMGKDTCGGCGMQNSQKTIAELSQKGMCICDNCKRVIYKN